MHQQNSEFISGSREDKSFFLSPQSLHSHWPNKVHLEKKTIVKMLYWPGGHEMSLYCSFISLLLSLTHFPHHTPPLWLTSVSFIFTIVIRLHLQPLPLSLLLSVVQCRSPHSACLQAVFLIFLNYSRHFLLFFFFSPNTSSKLHKPENWVTEGIQIKFTVNLQ